MSGVKGQRSRFRPIHLWRGVQGRLGFYPPDIAHVDHEHERSHVSLVLAGGFCETVHGREAEHFTGASLQRGVGARHAVRFGHAGTMILTFEACDAEGVGDGPQAFAGAPMGVKAAGRKPPPVELTRARTALLDTPWRATVEGLARQSGLHRVHFSRAFAGHFGMRPSVFRLRSMIGHALTLALTENLSLAESALAAGFADQSHLSRAVRAHCGSSIGGLQRRLLPV